MRTLLFLGSVSVHCAEKMYCIVHLQLRRFFCPNHFAAFLLVVGTYYSVINLYQHLCVFSSAT